MTREFEDQEAGDTRVEAYLRALHGDPAPARRPGRWLQALAVVGILALEAVYVWEVLSK